MLFFKLLLCFILLMIFMVFLRKQQILSRLASVVSSCVAHHPWVTTLTDGHSLRHHASPWAQEWNSSLAQREICGAEWSDHGRLGCDVRMVQEVTLTGLRLGFHSLILSYLGHWDVFSTSPYHMWEIWGTLRWGAEWWPFAGRWLVHASEGLKTPPGRRSSHPQTHIWPSKSGSKSKYVWIPPSTY